MLGPDLKPSSDVVRDLNHTASPLPDSAFLPLQQGGQAPLAPSQKGETLAEAGWGHRNAQPPCVMS